jgi:hypothetical protein
MAHPLMVTQEERTANRVTGKFFSRILIFTCYPARATDSSFIVNDVILLKDSDCCMWQLVYRSKLP